MSTLQIGPHEDSDGNWVGGAKFEAGVEFFHAKSGHMIISIGNAYEGQEAHLSPEDVVTLREWLTAAG